jgi:hypothetical protein
MTGSEPVFNKGYWDGYKLCIKLNYTANLLCKESQTAIEKAMLSGVTLKEFGEKASTVMEDQGGLTSYSGLMDDMTGRQDSSVPLCFAWQAEQRRSGVPFSD